MPETIITPVSLKLRKMVTVYVPVGDPIEWKQGEKNVEDISFAPMGIGIKFASGEMVLYSPAIPMIYQEIKSLLI